MTYLSIDCPLETKEEVKKELQVLPREHKIYIIKINLG